MDRPPARHSFGFAYDLHRSRAVLYGGKIYDGDRHLALDDLWIRDGSSWSEWRPPRP